MHLLVLYWIKTFFWVCYHLYLVAEFCKLWNLSLKLSPCFKDLDLENRQNNLHHAIATSFFFFTRLMSVSFH